MTVTNPKEIYNDIKSGGEYRIVTRFGNADMKVYPDTILVDVEIAESLAILINSWKAFEKMAIEMELKLIKE